MRGGVDPVQPSGVDASVEDAPAMDRRWSDEEHARPDALVARRRGQTPWITLGIACVAAFGVIHRPPPKPEVLRPFEATVARAALPFASPSSNALGKSGGVQLRSVLPRATVSYPLQIQGDPSALTYQWVRSADSVPEGGVLPLDGVDLVAPSTPGFYRLALLRDGERRVVDGLTIAVLVPFSEKLGATLDGYRIGTYLAEKLRGHDRPDGFVRVDSSDMQLPVSQHFRLADFVAKDGQSAFPRYAALNSRLLDKLELVLDELGGDAAGTVELNVHVNSGFRPPAYNRTVRRAAQDSRHQYGDAADVKIDADRDGRFTARDARLVMEAVERVERAHPELVGGLGLYTSGRYNAAYVHIDARGSRARWRG